MKHAVLNRVNTWVCLFITVVVLGAGCSALDAKRKPLDDSSSKAATSDKPDSSAAPRYYDFKDVLVPGDFTEDTVHSSVIEAGPLTSGFLAFYGRVDLQSVIHFYNIKMPENGWKPITVLKSPFSTIMIFSKDKRWCTINIAEKTFNTDLQIGIAPGIEN